MTKAWGAKHFLASHPSEPNWLYEPIHVPYTQWLQFHIIDWKRRSLTGRPGRKHLASIIPRGYGKTVTATKSATIWSMLDDPDMTILIQSATEEFSVGILKAQKSVLTGEDEDSWFAWLYGNWQSDLKDWQKTFINHSYRNAHNISEPSIDTSSSNIGSTGYHPRQCWWDDPLQKTKLRKDRVAYLRGQKEAVNASFNSVHTNGLISLVLTRYLDNDVMGEHFRTEGVSTWSGMPCPHMAVFDEIEFGKGIWNVFFYSTEDEATGEPTNPNLWSRDMIAQAKKRDSEDFACQQQNNPGSGEHAPLVESQIPWLYMTYSDFNWEVGQPQWATVHIDTAFKNAENIGQGDYNAIVVWLKDSRDNGRLYLDTDLLRVSNDWREEDFNKELVKVCVALRRRGIYIRAITDEKEPGGKEGSYKNRVLGILRTAGFMLSDDQFIQFNRSVDKKSRIRTAVGHWSEGYVRLLLHKGQCDCPPPEYDPIKNMYTPQQCPHYLVPPAVKTMIDQIVRVDVVGHDDLADAMTDGFSSKLWSPPTNKPGNPAEEGAVPRRPWDDDLKNVGKPMTNEELNQFLMDREEIAAQGLMTPGHGWDEDGWVPPREPV